jgi:hypothetical protein
MWTVALVGISTRCGRFLRYLRHSPIDSRQLKRLVERSSLLRGRAGNPVPWQGTWFYKRSRRATNRRSCLAERKYSPVASGTIAGLINPFLCQSKTTADRPSRNSGMLRAQFGFGPPSGFAGVLRRGAMLKRRRIASSTSAQIHRRRAQLRRAAANRLTDGPDSAPALFKRASTGNQKLKINQRILAGDKKSPDGGGCGSWARRSQGFYPLAHRTDRTSPWPSSASDA